MTKKYEYFTKLEPEFQPKKELFRLKSSVKPVLLY